jgi:integrase
MGPTCGARRLSVIREFARYCAIFEPRTEVPSARLLGPRCGLRCAPHIFTPAQIRLLLQRAANLPKQSLLQPHTYQTFFGLLACTGLRTGEARRLRLCDFDPVAGTLRVPSVKFSPERILPLHSTTVQALDHYKRLRTFLLGGEHLFVSRNAQPLRASLVDRAFRRIAAGIPCSGDRPRPRPHDLRHTFATQWIAQWSREDRPLSHYLLRLASYLGHRNMAMTWWYVSSDQRALAEAADRFARHRHGRDHSEP